MYYATAAERNKRFGVAHKHCSLTSHPVRARAKIIPKVKYSHIFLTAASNGHLALMQWANEVCAQHCKIARALGRAFRSGRLHICQYLLDTNPRLIITKDSVCSALLSGNVALLEWLSTREGYSIDRALYLAEREHIRLFLGQGVLQHH